MQPYYYHVPKDTSGGYGWVQS